AIFSFSQRTSLIEEHINAPAENLVVMEKAAVERLKQEIADKDAKIASLEREKQEAFQIVDGQIRQELRKSIDQSYAEGYERGKIDATQISRSLKERVDRQGLRQAIVTGSCDGFGRGNRFDEVLPIDRTIDVMFWLVDPSSQ